MSKSIQVRDVRELLKYVPQFSGRIFAVELRWLGLSDHLKSEIMLDLSVLQSIGVKVVIVVELEAVNEVVDWAIDLDLCLESAVQDSAKGVRDVISRGQIALVSAGQKYLASCVVSSLLSVGVDKVLLLLEGKQDRLIGNGVSVSQDAWQSQSEGWDFHLALSQMLENGVSRVHLLSLQMPGVILLDLFSNEGWGIMVYRDSYRQIRPIISEDIPEVLAMIGRSVRTSQLVPRQYEDIENSMQDYFVYQIDDNVIGCVALHHYSESLSEIACLYVKQGHQGHGHGERLVKFAEQKAQEHGVQRVFVLTNGAAIFFKNRLGYCDFEQELIPEQRRKALCESGRSSLAFCKQLC